MNTAVSNTSQATFSEDVIAAGKPVLVDFYADWCGPCKMVTPVVEALAGDLGEAVSVLKVDVDQNQELASTYGIRSIPTLVLFENGKPVESVTGVTSKEALNNMIQQYV